MSVEHSCLDRHIFKQGRNSPKTSPLQVWLRGFGNVMEHLHSCFMKKHLVHLIETLPLSLIITPEKIHC